MIMRAAPWEHLLDAWREWCTVLKPVVRCNNHETSRTERFCTQFNSLMPQPRVTHDIGIPGSRVVVWMLFTHVLRMKWSYLGVFWDMSVVIESNLETHGCPCHDPPQFATHTWSGPSRATTAVVPTSRARRDACSSLSTCQARAEKGKRTREARRQS